jgi:hypothetical protein
MGAWGLVRLRQKAVAMHPKTGYLYKVPNTRRICASVFEFARHSQVRPGISQVLLR